jgi:netrin-G3 ligand
MSLWQIHNVQDSTITSIQSLVTSETYTVRVLAFTSVGDGPFSDPVHVKVLPGGQCVCVCLCVSVCVCVWVSVG